MASTYPLFLDTMNLRSRSRAPRAVQAAVATGAAGSCRPRALHLVATAACALALAFAAPHAHAQAAARPAPAMTSFNPDSTWRKTGS